MVFGRSIPLLFAAPSALQSNIPLTGRGVGYISRKPTHLQSTVERSTINDESVSFGIADAVELSRQTYQDLATGCFITKASPTIYFQYTRPLVERSTNNEDFEEEVSTTRPLLLYLPGLDGQGISAVQQFDDLSNNFEFWRMRIDPVHDRSSSSFTELTTAVTNFIQDIAKDRKVILVGESFGGLLAPSVAMKCEAIAKRNGVESPIQGLVMVNPATSFYKTNWNTWAPILASLRHIEQEEEDGTMDNQLPTPYSVLGGMALSMTIPDQSQYQSILDMVTRTSVDELSDVLTTMRDGFGILADNLPAKVVEHRVGQSVMLEVMLSTLVSRICKLLRSSSVAMKILCYQQNKKVNV